MAQAPLAPTAHAVHSVLRAWPNWVTSMTLLIGAMVAAWIVYFILASLLPRLLVRREPMVKIIVARTRRPFLFALMIIAFASVIPVAPIAAKAQAKLDEVLSAAFVVLIGWSVIIVVDALSTFKLSRQTGNLQADMVARKHVTQWQILRRTVRVLTILITAAGALMAFPAVRAYGVSLLASAGAAGLVVGLAARPVLSNLIAGIQIAITQPLRVEDAVVINGQWGWVEEITSTYVVVRIWNWQRMIVPLAWLLAQPFQNWTRDSSELIGSVHINVDYTVPMEALRNRLDELVHSTKLWSGKVVVLQVTHALATTIELRALVSARNSSEAWDLRCLVREGLITFLQQNYPASLPKQRLEFEGRPAPADDIGKDEVRPLHELDLENAHP
jgi:small-conductance mechanosensitive channel